ncbi:MAG TPA: DUF2783 domain-containing protein [Aliiroseovarius sp.]|nr:DUF2783 domain-containing protein [Aliiroseovarius sp.]
MSELVTTKKLADHDGFYSDLLNAHKGLDAADSHALNARLVLILANHVGDRATLKQALDLARAEEESL